MNTFSSKAKKFSLMLMALLLTTANLNAYAMEWLPFEGNIGSEACVIYNLDTDELVYEKNSQQSRYMASVTKLMTALIISENYNLNGTIKSKKDYKNDIKKYKGAMVLTDTKGKLMPIKKNEVFKARALFDVMLLYSANDAALLFADTVAGSQSKFVAKMNAKAKLLGMKATRFTNPHGLSSAGDEINQYTTAADVAILAKAAYKNSDIMRSVNLKQVLLKSNFRTRTFSSSNKLTSLRTGVLGLKTGYTDLAGNCFTSIVRIGTDDYLVVSLGSKTRSGMFNDHVSLYKWIETALEGPKNLSPNYSNVAPMELPLTATEEEIKTSPVVIISQTETPAPTAPIPTAAPITAPTADTSQSDQNN